MTVCDRCGELCEGLTICQDCRDLEDGIEEESEFELHQKALCSPETCKYCQRELEDDPCW